MKTKNVVLFLVLVVVLFQGCIPSLHPLYTKDKLVMKQEILGTWIDNNSEDFDNLSFSSEGIPVVKDTSKQIPGVWIFEASDKGGYQLIYYDEKGVPAGFDVHLVKLGDDYFFNFYPGELEEEEKNHEAFDIRPDKFNNLEGFHYFPVNTFAKVTFDNEVLSISLFDGDFLGKLLDQNRIRIKHEKTDYGYILTAQPEELQQFIMKYADDEKAFPEPLVLTKSI